MQVDKLIKMNISHKTGFFISFFLILFVLSWHTITILDLSPEDRRETAFSDDSFYYLGPALNIAQGNGPTADGITKTNGFHPLWMGILVVTAFVTGFNPDVLFDLSLVLGALFCLGAGALLYRIAAAYLPPIWAIVWSVFFISGTALGLSTSGKEAPLIIFLITALLWVEIKWREKNIYPYVLGTLLGLIFLARTDAAFFLIGWFFFEAISIYLKENQLLAVVKNLLLPGLIVIFFASIWFGLSYYAYGTITQSSGEMKKLWRPENVSQLTETMTGLKNWLRGFQNYSGQNIILLLLIGLVSISVFKAKKSFDMTNFFSNYRPLVITIFSLSVYFILAGGYYATKFWSLKVAPEWYYGHAILGVIFIGILITSFLLKHDELFLKSQWFVMGLLIFSIFYGAGKNVFFRNYDEVRESKEDGEILRIAEYIDANLPDSVVIGSFNSGMLQYYTKHAVINLDGLNNIDIPEVYKNRAYDSYFKKRHITYIADFENQIPHNQVNYGISSFAHLTEVYSVPCTTRWNGGNRIVLWKLPE
ncbi:hypothetical protein Ctha_2367 [Chloroherpeton thalassium ATCC 35110]|uniref:Glycosyltransferase RgtA/B/C/D-like domain-containing protein n=1 Tax=Chloroherpeton thalassium (strain ATCC 35110 / GB-78) TaxID=517418 RepID=B3QX07_CHLT3|nr:hypothetical protein [Chloroherpeton thalassium]ACF14817.1 hypothetical protein Ctha_2367 [Chloroherpeton thalassium ATCC 35110]